MKEVNFNQEGKTKMEDSSTQMSSFFICPHRIKSKLVVMAERRTRYPHSQSLNLSSYSDAGHHFTNLGEA